MASRIITARSPGGRLLTIEHIDSATSTGAFLEEIARRGGHDGYVIVAEEITDHDPLPIKKEGDSSLYVSILLRPAMPPSRGRMLAALGALSLVRTVHRHSSLEAGVRWVGDVYAGKRRIATAVTKGALREDGSGFQYVIVSLSLRITDEFAGSLPEIVKSAFSPYRETRTDRISDTLINEFFTLYEALATHDHSTFLEEYRAASLLRGKRIRILRNGKPTKGTALGIDDNAGLVVALRRGGSTVLQSISEIVYRKHKSRK